MGIDSTNHHLLSEPIIYNQCFSDLDTVLEALGRNRNYQVFQLDPGPFQNKLNLVNFGDLQFSRGISNRTIQVNGDKPLDFVQFSIILNPLATPVFFGNIPLNSQYLWGFDSYKQIPMVIPANVEIASIFIHKDCFQDYLQQMNYPELETNLATLDYLFVPQAISTVQTYLQEFFYLIENEPDLVRSGSFRRLIREDFIPLFIQAIASFSESKIDPITSDLRSKIVKNARDYMMSHFHEPITLKDLCNNLYVSSRSLIYGFQEIFGISPMAYLKILRLHGVRQTLKKSNPAQTNVKNIANYFGFWSMGHFTRDYKLLFGELPSMTLRDSQYYKNLNLDFKLNNF